MRKKRRGVPMIIGSYLARQFACPAGLDGRIIALAANRQNSALHRETAEILKQGAFDSILEVGCGNGRVLSLLAKGEGTFTGVDVSATMAGSAKFRNRADIKRGRMRVSRQDAAALSFDNASFTKAFGVNVSYFWDDPAIPLSEIARVLRPGGVYYDIVYPLETLESMMHTGSVYNLRSEADFAESGAAAGFTVTSRPILGGKAICRACRKGDT